ncbi:hypothetical protein YC2023_117318 [Brassica napus]
MAVDEHDELPEATQTEAELQRQIDDLQGQVTRLHRAREDTNPELSSDFQILKEKIDEHSKQLEQSTEKLSQLESEVRPMPPLETPNSGAGTNLPTAAPGGEASTREKATDAHTYDGEDSDSEPEPDKEASDKAVRAESPRIAHLHQMFSDRLDAMQSMVERLPGAYNGTTDPDDHVAQYRQRMLAVALPKGSREATMSIASFTVLSNKFLEQFARSRDLEKTSQSLYEILQHRAEPLRGYIAA